MLESLSHPKEAALGKDMEEAQGITVSKIQEWEGRAWSFPSTSENLGSTGMCGNRETLAQGSSVNNSNSNPK